VLGCNPGGLREVICNPVPRPRHFTQFLSPEFLAVKARLETLIHPRSELPDEDLLPLARMTAAGDDVE
jgi:NitT/TauT family transport system ATP-binding protein